MPGPHTLRPCVVNFEVFFMAFLSEFWAYLSIRKKFWLLPIIVMMMIFGGLVVLSQGSVVAPFIYTIF